MRSSSSSGVGETAVANAYLPRDRRAASDHFAAVLVGQLQMGETAASEVVDRVQPPTGRFGAGLAEATAVAVAGARDAPGPEHGVTRGLFPQLADHHGVQELDRFVESILHRRVAHSAKPGIVAQAAV